MKAVCLIVLVAVALQVESMSIFRKREIAQCCETVNNRLISENIKSYNRTDDKTCKKKAFIVESKKGQKNCFNATLKTVLAAIEKFEKKQKTAEMKQQ